MQHQVVVGERDFVLAEQRDPAATRFTAATRSAIAAAASTEEREAGFLEAIAKHPDIHVISKDQFGGATQGESQTVALNMVPVLQKAQGIFCPNESSTLGMLRPWTRPG